MTHCKTLQKSPMQVNVIEAHLSLMRDGELSKISSNFLPVSAAIFAVVRCC